MKVKTRIEKKNNVHSLNVFNDKNQLYIPRFKADTEKSTNLNFHYSYENITIALEKSKKLKEK